MRIHSEQTISKLKLLRKRGHSIHALMREFSLPKTTIWHHIHSIKLSPKHINKLRLAGGESSRLRKKHELERADKESLKIIASGDKYLISLLAMLYWAEGNNKSAFSFVNTDATMIKLFIFILNKCFQIKKGQLLVTVRYFTGMNRAKCLHHWSEVTKVPKKEINMYYNDGGKSGRREFGLCRIGVRKSGYLFKLVRATIKNLVNEIVPVAQLEERRSPNAQAAGSIPARDTTNS